MTEQIGSLGEALLRAMGRVPEGGDGIKLQQVTDAALRKHAPSLRKAADAVEQSVRADGGMMLEIMDQASFTRAIIERFVSIRAKHIKVSLQGKGAGQKVRDTQCACARPDEHPNAATAAGGGHTTSDAQGVCAPANPKPGHARRTGAAMGGAKAATRKALLDVLRVNGQPLREVTAGEALRFAEKAKGDALKIERICTGLKEKEPVGQQITDEEAQRRAHPGTETR